MDPSIAALTSVIQALRRIQRVRYSELSACTIIYFDYFLTFDQEYELIWKSSWSFGKGLFLMNRYYTMLSSIFNNYALFSPNITDTFCIHWMKWQGWTGVITFIIAELILQLRLYALYHFDKRVLVFMCVVSFSAAAASAAIMGMALSMMSANAHTIPGTPFCVSLKIPGFLFTYWIPMLVSEVVLCALAVYRGVQNTRRGTTIFQTGRKLVATLIRDAVVYFFIIFTAYLINTIVFVVGTLEELEIPIGFAVALSCVMGNRLCLNVRGMLKRNNQSSVYITPTQLGESQYSSRVEDRNRNDASYIVNDLTATELSDLRTMRAHKITAV